LPKVTENLHNSLKLQYTVPVFGKESLLKYATKFIKLKVNMQKNAKNGGNAAEFYKNLK
jgi:hypothetical protein